MAPLKIPPATATKPKSRTSKPKKLSLSTELVQDSDDADSPQSTIKQKNIPSKDDGKKAHSKSKVKPNPNPVVSASPSPKSVNKSKSTIRPEPTKAVVEENATEEDSQDGTTTDYKSSASAASQPATPTPAKRTQVTSPPESQWPRTNPLSNDKSSKSSKELDTKAGKTEAPQDPSQKLSNEDSEDTESGSQASANESGSESESGSSTKSSVQSPRKSSPLQKAAPTPNIPPYEPPPGFKPASIDIHSSSEAAEILAPSNLADKQLWHITAPAGVPITSMTQISLQDIQSGTPVFSHKGAEYSLVADTDAEVASKRTLLLPSAQSNCYQPCKKPITKTLHLQQCVSLPSHTQKSTQSIAAAPRSLTHIKAPRQQPPGLKMRYHPFGVSSGSDSDAANKAPAKITEFRAPESARLDSQAKKRKRSGVYFSPKNETASPMKKSKKSKARHESPVEVDIQNTDLTSSLKTPSNPNPQDPSPHPKPRTANTPNPNPTPNTKPSKSHPSTSQSLLPTDLTKASETIMGSETINLDTSQKAAINEDSQIKAHKRKKERRKRKGPEPEDNYDDTPRTETPSQPTDQPNNQPPTQQTVQKSQLPTPNHSSPQKQATTATMAEASQSSERKATKEERAKRKEEKRKRKLAKGSC